ncbi:DUF6807 family protein [uncultured Draconibacterium sp.]|uniref:DUF6807 family protein n=1 Tax=uncultured Draconibacterium sp. TaxID=1573823 RepID=UPI0025CBB398|nr:DUF6807 family protein [uncultured Draconibacterium sp.]
MRRILFLFWVVFVLLGFESSAKIKVLLLSGRNNHDWKTSTPFLKKMYESTGLFEVKITEKPERLSGVDFTEIDVVVSNWSSFPDKEYRWPAETEQALLSFIKNGGGFLTLHAATTAFYNWPAFKEISTGAWIKETNHGKKCEARVIIEKQKHPITKGMGDFSTFEELWMQAEVNPYFMVLATAKNENTNKAGLGKQPVISVFEYGKGRICHNALGHEVRQMRNIGFQTLMLRATEWAATGRVKQEIPQDLKSRTETAVKAKYKWAETDSSYALLNGADVLWQYNFREKHQKPHFNPVFLGQNNMTCVSPDDHHWHAGQWFSWKYINGVNYWEYANNKEYRSEGINEIKDIHFTRKPDFSAKIELEIVYHPENGRAVLAETRTINVAAPNEKGKLSMDYTFEFTALAEEVELNRTPIEGEPNGKNWGGYGGLSIRFNQSFFDAFFIPSGTEAALHGQKRDWFYMGVTGLDGKKVGAQIIIHPNSRRDEAAWYLTNSAELPFFYFSPAYLFEKPYSFSEGEKLVLNYRINHIAGAVSLERLEEEYQHYKEHLNQ